MPDDINRSKDELVQAFPSALRNQARTVVYMLSENRYSLPPRTVFQYVSEMKSFRYHTGFTTTHQFFRQLSLLGWSRNYWIACSLDIMMVSCGRNTLLKLFVLAIFGFRVLLFNWWEYVIEILRVIRKTYPTWKPHFTRALSARIPNSGAHRTTCHQLSSLLLRLNQKKNIRAF